MNYHQIGVACFVWLCVFAPLRALAAPGFNVQVGDILAANYGGDSVLKITPQTGAQEILGSFVAPTDLALSTDGQLYVSELDGTVKRLSLSNGVVSVVNPNKTLTTARALVLGPLGDLFVTGSGNRVVKVDPTTGAETLVSQGTNLTSPVGIAWQDTNHLLVAPMLNRAAVIVALSNGSQTIPPGAAGINYAWGIGAYGGDIFFTRFIEPKVYRLSAGALSVAATTLGLAYGLGIETNGNLVVASTAPDAIERFTPQGALLNTYSGGAIRQVTGIEISTIQVTPVVPQLHLQSSQTADGPYGDDPDAVWYAEAQTFAVNTPPNNRFYRVRGNCATHIIGGYISRNRLWIDYEHP